MDRVTRTIVWIALLFMAILFFVLRSRADEVRPHPYAAAGLVMSNSGTQSVAPLYTGGVDYRPRFVFLQAEGQYESARKTNDNTEGNTKGHTRRLEGLAFYRIKRWDFGGGYSWSKLDTTNYGKSSGHPELGGGFNWKGPRLQVLYVLPGNDWQNGVQGVKATLTIPIISRVFVSVSPAVYRCYDTVTNPADASTTAMEKSHHSFFEVFRYQMGWRF